MADGPKPLIQHGIQVCFCGEGSTGLPAEPLDAHDPGCLIWDWAAANGLISPQVLLAKLGQYAGDLGLSDEEIAREASGD